MIPFALADEAVSNIIETYHSEHSWSGKWDSDMTGPLLDTCFLTVCSLICYDVTAFSFFMMKIYSFLVTRRNTRARSFSATACHRHN